MHVFDLQELEAATDGFSPSQLIGKGSHGSVYRGRLNGAGNLTVAVKRQSVALQTLQDNTKLENEASILSSFPSTSSTWLISLLGVSRDSRGNKIIVTNYMPNGTLHEALHGAAPPPSWRRRVETAVRVAKGVRYLHESSPHRVVHRDIKPANILFDEAWGAKLADFGLATRMHVSRAEPLKLPAAAGTIGYIDPGYTAPGKLSTKVDVFSYGVVVLELISGRKAMDVGKSPPSIVEWALPLIEKGRWMEVCDERVRLPSDDVARGAVKRLLRVASRCVSLEESSRPEMGEVVASLEGLRSVGGMIRFSRSSFREVILKMMGLRKLRLRTNINSISKGTLLVREILADITLK